MIDADAFDVSFLTRRLVAKIFFFIVVFLKKFLNFEDLFLKCCLQISASF